MATSIFKNIAAAVPLRRVHGISRWMLLLALVVLSAATFLITRYALGATLTVTTTNDVVDGNTTSIANLIATPGADGVISLREAITAVNNNGGGPHTIHFNISGCGGVCTISPSSALPALTTAVILDGWSQPGWSSAPLIELNGTNAGNANGLRLSASGNTIRGLTINRFALSGIVINAGADNNTVQGNYLGTSNTGLVDQGNGNHGIYVSTSSNNQIGGTSSTQRNIFSGNDGTGIYVDGGSSNTIVGNYVGLGANGSTAVGNGDTGISINNSPNNVIGGTSANSGNLVSANTSAGIRIRYATSTGNHILGNWVGLAADGTTARGNGTIGVIVHVSADNTQIGDGTTVGRNVISGATTLSGIQVSENATNTTIQGNYIGTNAAGSAAIANNTTGILVGDGASAQIGGTTSGQGNLISGNTSHGIIVITTAISATIQGNMIGTNADGSAVMGNGGAGISVFGGVANIGGTAAGAGNTVRGSGSQGIRVSNANTRASVLGNQIYGNASLGIDLNNDGVTANNGTKSESLPNRDMDYPVFTSVIVSGSTLFLSGYVGSAANQNTFAGARVEVFLSDNDASGYGEGQTYLGTLTTDASGNFSGSFTAAAAVVAGNKVTGTATDTTTNNSTSEFGPNFTVTTSAFNISGNVFEDKNYAGGSGRSRATALANGGSVRSGARLELYSSTGAFITTTTTDGSGNYSFSSLAPGTYTVRVVNNTVTSSRTGYTASQLAVQTFRTDASSGSALGVYDYVGGQTPSRTDADSNTTNATLASLTTGNLTPQSITTVTGTTSAISGVDFGYSFNVVVNINDSGQGSLRQFINNANALSNTGIAINGRTAGIDHAVFMISNGTADAGLRASNNYFTAGTATISCLSGLPSITEAVVIDAQTQSGWSLGPIVEINGTSAGAAQDGFTLNSSGNTVRGLIITRFSRYGVHLTAGADSNTLQGNHIGTDRTGGVDRGNSSYGIYLASSSNNMIGGASITQRNVVSGNDNHGIYISGGGSNSVQGNHVGIGANGQVGLGNTGGGVWIDNSANNTIGGALSGQGNVIGSNASGISIRYAGSVGNTVLGNLVGLAADGDLPRINLAFALSVSDSASNTQIGDGSTNGRNVLSGATSGEGVRVQSGVTNTTIIGNYIGTNALGTSAVANGNGIGLQSGSTGTQIGGSSAGQGNLISGNNTAGIAGTGDVGTVTIQGNQIGSNAAGTGALANGSSGISLSGGVITIGGTAAGTSNLIRSNGSRGIGVSGAATRASILGNRVYSNGSIGIDLDNNGVTTNNGTKSESLPNRDMDYPVFTSVAVSGTTLYLVGYVGSAANQSTFAGARVEVFLSDNDASGYGEGQTYLGTLTTDASGNFNGSFTAAAAVVAGNNVTGAATDTTTHNSTSEFGPNFTVTTAAFNISGSVFEDKNYAGGNGRNRSTAISDGGSARSGARVELYDNAGAYVSNTTTDGSGNYSFSSLSPGTYTVRVVNNTVTSSRTGYTASQLAVQTFRTDASSGSAVDVYDYVGGQTPNLVDAGSNTTNATLASLTAGSATPQSITTVTGTLTAITDVDFGYSFNVVVNTNDSGQGSLRQFITNANALSNTGIAINGRTASIDHAVFMISNGTAAAGLRSGNDYFSSGVATIAPTSALPTITEAVVIDAQTQPGWTSAPIVELNGIGAGASNGLLINAGSCTFRGLVINRFFGAGIYIAAGGYSNHVIQGNYIGTSASGLAASANGFYGIHASGSSNNQIGGSTTAQRNVVSANGSHGIYIASGGSNTVQGNYLGLGADGQTARGNTGSGLYIEGSASNMVGGTSAAERNLIGSNSSGIYVRSAGSIGNTLLGNWVGLAADGTTARSNNSGAVIVSNSASNTQIGDGSANGRNVLSGSVGGAGVTVQSGVSSTTIVGNYIGTNAAGSGALANVSGISLESGSTSTQIGGTTAGQGNLISGNSTTGIAGTGDVGTVTIQGNQIGSDAAGTGALANGSSGISLSGGLVAIGGTAAGAGNLIRSNSNRGISVSGAAARAAILGNRIYGNSSVGIDLGANGVTANNGTKSESLPNRDMDFPVFTSAAYDGTTLYLTGYVGSAANQSTFAGARVEFFISDNDASGYGEGQTYIGTLTTDASGNFNGSFVPASTVVVGDKLSATATDTTTHNSTSEFGSNTTVQRMNMGGVVFEDVNYGGGAGRNRSAALADGGVVRSDARVELYDNTGAFVTSTTTDSNGVYRFSGQATGTYTVRVVNSSVTSSRSGYTASQLAVQTFRSNASSGTAVDVTDYVGGQTPNLVDAGANLTSASLASLTAGNATAQSIASVVDSGTTVANVDFGYSFNVVVNVNDSGQGSLRQFISNANALSNTGLAMSGRTAGIDHALFMISNGTAAAGLRSGNNYFSSGVATIALTTHYADITDPVVIDAQTQPGWVSTPVVELNGISVGGLQDGLSLLAVGNTVRGLAINRFPGYGIYVHTGANDNVIQGNYIGTDATGLIDRGNGQSGIYITGSIGNQIGGSSSAQRNVIGANGSDTNLTHDGITLASTSNATIQGNYIGVGADGLTALGNGRSGITIGASYASVGGTAVGAGNVISANALYGVHVTLGHANGSTLLGNSIGVASDGTSARGNTSDGVFVSGSPSIQVGDGSSAGRNVISGNGGNGIRTSASAGTPVTTVRGNYIGTNAAGTAALANTSNGILINTGTLAQIGGASAGEGNLISGNTLRGIQVHTASTIQGNKIGTNAAGTAAIANGSQGIRVLGDGAATIGGASAGAGNLISGNTSAGLQLESTNNVVQGNTIGLDAGGTTALPNVNGVRINISTSPGANTVGGSSSAARNVISGNTTYDFYIENGHNVTVQGNYIGPNAAGSAAPTGAPNNSGIYIATGTNNVIGGTTTGEGNLIAFHGTIGVRVTGNSSNGNAIRGNSIHSNTALGIDLGNSSGVTANDGAKTAGDPNLYMDSPVFTNASYDGTVLRVRGYVGSAPNQTTFASSIIDVFISDEDATGYGEGRTYLGSFTADGNGAWNGTITTALIAVGNKLTATATDTSGNTSEFGANYDVRAYAPFRNGSFEDGVLGGTSNFGDGDYWALPVASTAVDYWVVENAALNVMPSTYWNASNGVRSVDLNHNAGAGAISQTFDTEVGTTYSVFVDYSGSAACGPTRKGVRISAAGTSSDLSDYLIGGSGVIPTTGGSGRVYDLYYDTGLFRFTAVTDLTTLKFESLSSGLCGAVIDNVRVQVADPFTNGGFETGSDPGNVTTLSNGSSAINHWVVGGNSINYVGSLWTASEGSRSVRLDDTGLGSVAQTFDALPEVYYRARFALSADPNGSGTRYMNASAGGTTQSFNSANVSNPLAWTDEAFVFRATDIATTLDFASLDATGAVIDNVRIEDAYPFINGSFEDVRFPLRASTDLSGDTKLIRGWVTSGTALQHWGSATFAPSLGSYSVHLNGSGGAGTLSQTFDVVAGESYDILFDAAANPTLAANQTLIASIVDGGITTATRTVTLNPSNVLGGQTRWRAQQISFTAVNSRVTLSLASQTVGSAGLAVDNVRYGVAGTMNTTGQFNAFETSTAANSATGVIKTKLVGQAFSLDIAAVKLDRTGYSNYPMSGIKIELIDASDDSGALDELTNCRSSWTSIATVTSAFALTGPDNGRKAQSFTVNNAYRNLRVKISYPGSGTATHVGCSNDNFAVRPSAFSNFTASDGDDSTAGTTRVLNNSGTNGVVHRAGRPFTVIATAVDGNGSTVASYDGTPQLSAVSCVVPVGCSAGALAGSASSTSGVVTGNAFTYAEGGSITVQLVDATFADVDSSDSTQAERAIELGSAATLGRFVADRYQLSVSTAPSMVHGTCGAGPGTQGFTFVGQNFGFATAPVIRATPLNAAGVALNNARPTFDATHVSTSFVAVGASVALNGSASISSITAGSTPLINYASSTFSFARNASTPVASFAPTFTLTVDLSDTSEPGATAPIAAASALTVSSIGFSGGAGNNIHYGRVLLRPGYADLRSDLYLPLEVQRYSALGWQTLSDAGTCVSAAATAFAYSQATGLLNGGGGVSNCSSRVTGSVTTIGGRASIVLPKPTGGATPSAMTITLNVDAASGTSCSGPGTSTAATSINQPWLAGTAGAAPSARVSWGAPRSEYLLMRERYD